MGSGGPEVFLMTDYLSVIVVISKIGQKLD